MLLAIVLDIPVARQTIGFVYLSFIPGMLILRILKLNPKSAVNELLFSVGLSIAFIMFVGLFVNGLFPLIGVSEPLSILPLAVAIGAILLILSLISYKRMDLGYTFSLPSTSQVLRAFVLVLIPLLAIFGALLANSLILLLMIAAVVVLVVTMAFSKKLIPVEAYPFVILIIALSLMFQREFISSHLLGWDVFGEFHVFRLTNTNSLWNPLVHINASELLDYNSMLSVTVLPTVYSKLLNVSGELIFKIFYLLFYSVVPLAMYETYKHGFGKSTALLSAFYFVSFPRFYGEERRQIIGQLFLVLLIATILSQNIAPTKKKILLCIFGFALVMSHYSISYIFVFCILFAWSVISVMKKLSVAKFAQEGTRAVDGSCVLLILILNVFWYVFVTPAIASTFSGFVTQVATSFINGFGNVETRGGAVSNIINPNFSNTSLIFQADFVINKIPFILIIIGSFALIRNYRKKNINLEYLLMALASLLILLLVLLVPFLAPAFLADRFYHVSLLFLAPVCVYGGEVFLKWVLKPLKNAKRARSISLRILAIFFVAILLFKSGFLYEVAGDVSPGMQISVSFTRMKTSDNPQILSAFYEPYVPEQDFYSATWLANMVENNSKIYADYTASKHVLKAYAMKIIEWNYILSGNTTIGPDAYIYLRSLNVQGFLVQEAIISNMTKVSNQLNLANKIYSNGGSEVYLSLNRG
jgi:uncharacterized membrane protein